MNIRAFLSFLLAVFTALPVFLTAPAARAQNAAPGYTLALGFTPSSQFGSPGDTLNFSGVVGNVTQNTVFLNGDSLTFNGPGTADESPFLNGVPNSLDPMGTVDANGNPTDTYSGSFFDVSISPDAAPGTYFGTFSVLGGADADALDELTSDPKNTRDPFSQERFSVTVLAPIAAVPEASTTLSFGGLLMLGGLLIVVQRRKARAL